MACHQQNSLKKQEFGKGKMANGKMFTYIGREAPQPQPLDPSRKATDLVFPMNLVLQMDETALAGDCQLSLYENDEATGLEFVIPL